LTASWEKGLTYVAEGSITQEEYMEKLEAFVARNTIAARDHDQRQFLRQRFSELASCYTRRGTSGKRGT
ncbi:MAG: hypothetical protein HUJ73_07860, partial [Eubacterium sp.]|nr:hypothetical protein [Eubacterium sp.]